MAAELRGAGVRVPTSTTGADMSFGRRATDWELKGVPVRIEVGPRDLAEGEVTLVRRDAGTKVQVPLAGAAAAVATRARGGPGRPATPARSRAAMPPPPRSPPSPRPTRPRCTGFARLPWAAVGGAGEAELAQSGITVRCLQRADGTLPRADDEADLVALVARSY